MAEGLSPASHLLGGNNHRHYSDPALAILGAGGGSSQESFYEGGLDLPGGPEAKPSWGSSPLSNLGGDPRAWWAQEEKTLTHLGA